MCPLQKESTSCVRWSQETELESTVVKKKTTKSGGTQNVIFFVCPKPQQIKVTRSWLENEARLMFLTVSVCDAVCSATAVMELDQWLWDWSKAICQLEGFCMNFLPGQTCSYEIVIIYSTLSCSRPVWIYFNWTHKMFWWMLVTRQLTVVVFPILWKSMATNILSYLGDLCV